MRKQGGCKEDENALHSEPKQMLRQPLHSTIIPPSNLNFMQGHFAIQADIDAETATYSSHDLKPHLTELRPVAESTLGHIQSIFIPSTQHNGYEMMPNNSSFLTPSPQPNPVFTMGMPPSTSPKLTENENDDRAVSIKTETPPDTPASESIAMTFSSKLAPAKTISDSLALKNTDGPCKKTIVLDEDKVTNVFRTVIVT